jgi:hypothetical protein
MNSFIKKTAVFSLILLFSSFAFLSASAQTVVPATPKILSIAEGALKNKPIIEGAADIGSFVHIYIDGAYNGKTNILTAGLFSYAPYLNLSAGEHNAWAIAENGAGEKSGLSNIFKFTIKPGVPAPTLFTPAMNKNNPSHPFIIGVAKNDLTIKVYIDNKYDGEFKVENHESGTASFSYQILENLGAGAHSAYATATDNNGENSQSSNTVNFQIAGLSAANEDNADGTKENSEEKNVNGVKIENGSDETGAENNEGKSDDENEKNISSGLIIFILFLAGIIGWIIWVNRELVKEKMGKKSNGNNTLDKK